jgi:uncharacterized protein (TIGR03435 family)
MKAGMTVFLWLLGGLAQTADQPPTFEAATLKTDTTSTSETGAFEHGRLLIKWATLRHLVATAYSIPVDDVRGGPKWADTSRFDVSAKGDEKASEADSRLMLRALLAERFHLRVHKEDQPERVYLLQVGPHGLKLQDSTGNSTAPSGCFGQMTCRKATMATLARALRANGTGVDAPVMDETGVKGSYGFTLHFVVDAGGAENANGPTIFDALQEQLGLKLQATKRPVDVMVIDDVQPLSGQN